MGKQDIFLACKNHDFELFMLNYDPKLKQLLSRDIYFLTPLHYVIDIEFFEKVIKIPEAKKVIKELSEYDKELFILRYKDISKYFLKPTNKNIKAAFEYGNIPLMIELRKNKLRSIFKKSVKTIIKYQKLSKKFDTIENEPLGPKIKTRNTTTLLGEDLFDIPTRLLWISKQKYAFTVLELQQLNGICPYTKTKIKKVKLNKTLQAKNILDNIHVPNDLLYQLYKKLDTQESYETFKNFMSIEENVYSLIYFLIIMNCIEEPVMWHFNKKYLKPEYFIYYLNHKVLIKNPTCAYVICDIIFDDFIPFNYF